MIILSECVCSVLPFSQITVLCVSVSSRVKLAMAKNALQLVPFLVLR